ncbi:MAG: GGDEF domain-containing protein [Pseudomonadota bacterium]
MSDQLEKIQQAQQLRMQRFLMSVILYGIWATMTIVAKSMDMLQASSLVLWALGLSVTVNVAVFWWLIRSGTNLRFKDPSMTFAQCSIGLTWVVLFMFCIPEWRDLQISVYLIVLMFGVFQMRARDFSMMAFMAFAGFVALNLVEFALDRNQRTFIAFLFQAGAVGSLLIWAAFFGNHVGSLRERLQRRNEELREVVAKVTHLAERDHLTQAFNRRSILETLGVLREGALRYSEVFSIVILDLDYFKQINDRFGHLTGDDVLTEFASRARSELRLLDEISPVVRARQLGRYGGEEFIIILPRTDLRGAIDCAERIRRTTVDHQFGQGLNVTVSAGVAQFSAGESIEDLLRRADDAMYKAKAAGRNTVSAAEHNTEVAAVSHSEVVRLADYQSDE